MRKALMLATASLAIAGCSGQSDAAAAPPSGEAAHADQSAADPAAAAFVRSLYSVETGGRGEAVPDYDGDLQSVSSARTAALFAEAKALTPEGYIGYPEGHPLVEYEEWGSLRIQDVVTTQHGPDRADVALVLAFTQPDQRLTRVFNLVKEDGRWRLDDLQYDQVDHAARFGPGEPRPSLLEGFHHYIADAKANPIEGE